MSEVEQVSKFVRTNHHGAFISEGRAIAFPLCFPGASAQIAADESHITALDVSPEGDVYGATSGPQSHAFVGMFRGVTGYVFDMGILEGGNEAVAMCCGRERFAVFVNGPDGGCIWMRDLQELPFDLIQEWGFSRRPFEEIKKFDRGESILHAVADETRKFAVGITERCVFALNLETGEIESSNELDGKGRIAILSSAAFGLDADDTLWRYDIDTRHLVRQALCLPQGEWTCMQWARDSWNGMLYLADDEGRLFSLQEGGNFSTGLAQAPLAPVTTLAVIPDGRVFGMCGGEMQHFFVFDPKRNAIRDLGIAASTIERRRYGYIFGDGVAGRDGEIYLGENDDLGHLWIYYPRIEN